MKQNNNSITMVFIILVAYMVNVFYINRSSYDMAVQIQELKYKIELDSLRNENAKLKAYQDSVKLYQLNWNNIDYWLDQFDVKHKEIVKQQIYLETGNLSSDICRNNNNLFGMRYPRVRKTTAIGIRKSHAQYASYVDSIRDYAIWQQNRYDGSVDYYSFLVRIGYAECDSYISKLRYIANNVNFNDRINI